MDIVRAPFGAHVHEICSPVTVPSADGIVDCSVAIPCHSQLTALPVASVPQKQRYIATVSWTCAKARVCMRTPVMLPYLQWIVLFMNLTHLDPL